MKNICYSLTAIVVVFTMPAAAQETVFSPSTTETCLQEMSVLTDPQNCIGASANICMEQSEGGSSTVGMGNCFNSELQYWDARLNVAYKQVRSNAEAIDAEMAEIGSSAPSQAQALLEMQRAWIAYRDATCIYQRTLWGGGTGGGPASVACHMFRTAEQALFLESQLGDQ